MCSCSKVTIAPMGKLLTCLPRLTLAQLRTLWSTTGGECAETLQSSHRPDGKIADTLASTHACTTAADAPVNYSLYRFLYVPQRPSMFPIGPDGNLADVLASTLAGTTVTGASVNYSMYVQQRLENFPSPNFPSPMARCLQGGGVFVSSGTVAISSCTISGNTAIVRAHVQKFPAPRWENC